MSEGKAGYFGACAAADPATEQDTSSAASRRMEPPVGCGTAGLSLEGVRETRGPDGLDDRRQRGEAGAVVIGVEPAGVQEPRVQARGPGAHHVDVEEVADVDGGLGADAEPRES